MIESYYDKEGIKKAKRFTQEQVIEFLKKADVSNRYWLSRMVVAVLGYFSKLRLFELRKLRPECVQENPNGFLIAFTTNKGTLCR